MRLAAIGIAAALCGLATAQVPAQQRMVVVISLDGFPAFALDDPKLPVPTLRRLIRDGITARMTIVNPTVRYTVITMAIVLGLAFFHYGEVHFWHKQAIFWSTVAIVMYFMFKTSTK